MTAGPVLYVNHVSVVSGAEESLLSLLSRLDQERFSPVLACPPGALAARAAEAGIRTCPLPVPRFKRTRNPLKMSTYALAWVAGTNHLRKIVSDVGPILIHANSATAQIYAGSVAQKAGIPCIWHARDLRPLPFPVRSLCSKADRIIAISDSVADFLALSGLPRTKIARIHNGIDPDAWRARVTGRDVRAELGLAEDARILLMAAQFVPWKRHEDAVSALPFILTKEASARLVLAGADHFGEHPGLVGKLKELALQLGVYEQVIFADHRDDLPDLMATADLVVIPSDAEPFGRVAIEAMAMEKPVVGTRAGGLPEVVRDGETGLLVVPRFPESLATACLRVLENPSFARRLGEAGRARVETHFHINEMARKTHVLYDAVLHPPLKRVHV